MKRYFGLIAILGLAFLVGCGGGDSPANILPVVPPALTTDSPRGTLSNIPQGTKSVLLSVRNTLTGAIVDSRLLPVASVGGVASSLSANYPALPTGTFQATAVAYSDSAGIDNPIASGAITTQITVGKVTTLDVPLALTLSKVAVTATVLNVSPYANQTHVATVTASLTDNQNRSLKYPVTWSSSHPEIATVTFDPNSPYVASVTGIAEGTSTVTLVEPNSGMTSVVAVTVRIQ